MQINSREKVEIIAGNGALEFGGLDEFSTDKSHGILAAADIELIQRLNLNLEVLTEMTERLGFMMREIQYLTR